MSAADSRILTASLSIDKLNTWLYSTFALIEASFFPASYALYSSKEKRVMPLLFSNPKARDSGTDRIPKKRCVGVMVFFNSLRHIHAPFWITFLKFAVNLSYELDIWYTYTRLFLAVEII